MWTAEMSLPFAQGDLFFFITSFSQKYLLGISLYKSATVSSELDMDAGTARAAIFRECVAHNALTNIAIKYNASGAIHHGEANIANRVKATAPMTKRAGRQCTGLRLSG